jgi:hypothetical protein
MSYEATSRWHRGEKARREVSACPRPVSLARARARTRTSLRDLRVSPIPRMGVAGPSAAPASQPPAQLRNSTEQSPPEAREECDGSGIACFMRVKAVHTRGRLQTEAWESRPGPTRPSRTARRRRSKTFREGGGTHGPDHHIDRAARRGCARRGRLGILAVSPVTLALSDLPPGRAATLLWIGVRSIRPGGGRDAPVGPSLVGARGRRVRRRE